MIAGTSYLLLGVLLGAVITGILTADPNKYNENEYKLDEWLRTDKILPEKYGRYIVTSAEHGVCIERFAADYKWWYGSELQADETVTAWQHLPDEYLGDMLEG